MKLLFIIYDEVSRRSISPIIDLFFSNGDDCRILKNSFSVSNLSQYHRIFISESASLTSEWSFVVSSTLLEKDKYRGARVSIPHGTMFGNSSWSLSRALNSDIYFGISPYELAYIKYYLKEKFDSVNFFSAGNPANDHLELFRYPPLDLRTSIRKRYGLQDKNTILLSSHWTSLGNFRKFGVNILDAITSSFPDSQVICTCHPKLLTSPKTEFRIDKLLPTPDFVSDPLSASFLSRQNSNVKVVFNLSNTAELLFISDLFVGDNSSLVTEASFFNIPLLLQCEGSFFDRTVSNLILSDTHQFDSLDNLIEQIKYIDRSDISQVRTGRKIKQVFLYNVGRSAKLVFDTLHSLK